MRRNTFLLLLIPCLALGCLDGGPFPSGSANNSTGGGGETGGGGMTNTGSDGGSTASGGSSSTGGSGGTTSSSQGGSGGMAGSGGSGGCNAAQKVCDENCVAVNDPEYGCDEAVCTPCDIPQAQAMCMDQACEMEACDAGFDDCNASVQDGCEINTQTNSVHCGSCGKVCQADEACSQGTCVPTCGTKPIPVTGYAACWVLNNSTLAIGKYATMTVGNGAPAASGPSDPVSAGCVSSVPANADNSNDPSVLCPLTGLVSGGTSYMALKAYDSGNLAAANPPLPFSSFKCDNQDVAGGKCIGMIKIYKDAALVGTFVHPVVSPFSYYDENAAGVPIQIVYTAQ